MSVRNLPVWAIEIQNREDAEDGLWCTALDLAALLDALSDARDAVDDVTDAVRDWSNSKMQPATLVSIAIRARKNILGDLEDTDAPSD